MLAPILRGSFVADDWTLEPELPFLYYDVDYGTLSSFLTSVAVKDSGFVAGNPSLSARYHSLGGGSDVWIGAGIAFPLAQIKRSDENALPKIVGYSAALAARGYWNIWQYFPEALTLWVPVGARHVDARGIDIGAEGAVALYAHVGEGSHDPIGNFQLGFHLGYASDTVETGLRLHIVRLPGDSNKDDFQASLEPYLRLLFTGGFVESSVIMNAGKPAGDFFDEGAVWGFRLAAGATF